MSEPNNFVALIEDAPDHPWGRKFKPLSIQDARWTCLRFTPGTKVVISMRQWRPPRSLKANGYYWGVVLPALMEASGDDPRDAEARAELHDLMKAKFNAKAMVDKKTGLILTDEDGKEICKPQSTSKLDSQHFTAFVDNVIRWGSMFLGADVPPPERSIIDGAGI